MGLPPGAKGRDDFKSPQHALEPSPGNQTQSLSAMVRSRGENRRLSNDKEQDKIRISGTIVKRPRVECTISQVAGCLSGFSRNTGHANGLVGFWLQESCHELVKFSACMLCTWGRSCTLSPCEAHAKGRHLSSTLLYMIPVPLPLPLLVPVLLPCPAHLSFTLTLSLSRSSFSSTWYIIQAIPRAHSRALGNILSLLQIILLT